LPNCTTFTHHVWAKSGEYDNGKGSNTEYLKSNESDGIQDATQSSPDEVFKAEEPVC